LFSRGDDGPRKSNRVGEDANQVSADNKVYKSTNTQNQSTSSQLGQIQRQKQTRSII